MTGELGPGERCGMLEIRKPIGQLGHLMSHGMLICVWSGLDDREHGGTQDVPGTVVQCPIWRKLGRHPVVGNTWEI